MGIVSAEDDEQGEVTVFPWETGQGWTKTKQTSERWTFLEASYFGNGGYADGRYLIPHRREDEDAFSMRKQKSRFINDFRAIINGHVTPIFRGDATRTWLDALIDTNDEAHLKMFLADCDGAGTPYPMFMKKTARAGRQYGCTFVLCDRSPLVNVMTMADLKKRGNLPFLFLITPDRILDIAMNEKGEVVYIKWLTYKEDIEDRANVVDVTAVTGVTSTASDQATKITIEWTPKNISRTVEGEEVVNTTNELGFVPVFPLYPEGNDDPVLEPFPYGMEWSLASIQNRVFNIASLADELADTQAYSILAIPGELAANKTLGTGNALTGMPIQGNMPAFLSPDATQLSTLSELQRSMVEEMYRTGVMPHLRTFAESVESKMLNSERTYEVLVDFRGQIQQLDKQLINCVGKYMNVDYEYEVVYPQKFGLSNLETDLDVYEKFDTSATPVPPELMSELVKRIHTVLFQGKSEDAQQDMDKIIEGHYATVAELRVVEDPEETPVKPETEE